MRTIKLCQGMGVEGQSHCVMAATSILAGEGFTDMPNCVCDVIAQSLIIINDSFREDNKARQEMLAHLPWILIGTKCPKKVRQRRMAILESELASMGFKYDYLFENLQEACKADYKAETYHRRQRIVDLIEKVMIPMHTTMPIEQDYNSRLKNLITY